MYKYNASIVRTLFDLFHDFSPHSLQSWYLSSLLNSDDYKKKVKEYVKKYATEAALKEAEGNPPSSSESSMSEFEEDVAQDMDL